MASAEINLFYNEEFDGKAIVVTVKFANNIVPKEFLSFHKIVVDALRFCLQKTYLLVNFLIFFARPMMKGKCLWEIPKRMSVWAMERGCVGQE